MNYKFQVLKSSWGIVIFVEIVDQKDAIFSINDVAINEYIFIRVNAVTKISDEKVKFWFAKAIMDVQNELHDILGNSTVCFIINSIDFVLTDFQEEGLYCVMSGWLQKRYGLTIPKIEIEFDSQLNKYFFKKDGSPLAFGIS